LDDVSPHFSGNDSTLEVVSPHFSDLGRHGNEVCDNEDDFNQGDPVIVITEKRRRRKKERKITIA